MKAVVEAVKYYTEVTGDSWEMYYSNIDPALEAENPEPNSILWLVGKLTETLLNKGLTVDQIKSGKDVVKEEFESDSRFWAGEYFTPEVWCAEGRKYIEKHVPFWGSCKVWDASCGSGNLMRTANYPQELLYMSTLQPEDVAMVHNSPEYKNATCFPLDFVNGIDYDEVNTEFLDKLPADIQDCIRNDKPIVMYMNPPYKIINSKDNELGNYMLQSNTRGLNISRAACDIYYQFLYRLMRWVELFELKNFYLGVFGPATLFTGMGFADFNTEFQTYFNFIDGMYISAREFSGTSTNFEWGVSYTLWKANGADVAESGKADIMLDEKYIVGGEAVTGNKLLFDIPRIKLTDWLKPKDVSFYRQAPSLTSHTTFKGQEPFVMKAEVSGKMAEGALCTIMSVKKVGANSRRICLLSSATTMDNESVTKENFWRAVGTFSFGCFFKSDWKSTKRTLTAPHINLEGYQEWLYSSIPMFLFFYNNRTSSLRGVEFGGKKINIPNQLFYLSADEVKECCTDPVILKDLEDNPPSNEFMLQCIEESRSSWSENSKQLFDMCVRLTKETYAYRKDYDYKGCTQAWDAGFHQLRYCLDMGEEVNKELLRLVSVCRDELGEHAGDFGFIANYEEAQ